MEVATQIIASTESRIVVGLGATGLSCARFLRARGLPFAVFDTREQPPGLADLQAEMPEVPVYTGTLPGQVAAGASEYIVSPGVAMDAPIVQQAAADGAVVCGDIDLFMREAQAPVVGITGSNAKSTVTELVGQMARDAGLNVGVGGNLGTPALALLSPERQLYVLELSSFQLERAGVLGLQVATVLNVSPDHLDRHGSMPAYHQAKHRIFRGCQQAVYHRADALTRPLVADDVPVLGWTLGIPDLNEFGLRSVEGVEQICVGFEPLMPVAEVALMGRHNLGNALAALALGHSVDLPVASMCNTLRRFRGLPHRCETVATVSGVHFVNDSKGTNIGATEAALNGLGEDRNIVLIAGGQSKGADFALLRPAVEQHCKAVVLIGEDAPLIERALGGRVQIAHADSMASALRDAVGFAASGDVVLLSPACASFDMFSGYEDRGRAFVTAVNEWRGELGE